MTRNITGKQLAAEMRRCCAGEGVNAGSRREATAIDAGEPAWGRGGSAANTGILGPTPIERLIPYISRDRGRMNTNQDRGMR